MALTDALGNLTALPLLPGHADDPRGTAVLVEGLSCGKLLVNRALDANWLREALAEAGIEAVIPPESNRRLPAEFDCNACNRRHLIENFFGKRKELRGTATRCCRTGTSFNTFINLASTVIRLRSTATELGFRSPKPTLSHTVPSAAGPSGRTFTMQVKIGFFNVAPVAAQALVFQKDLRDPCATRARVANDLAADVPENPWLVDWKQSCVVRPEPHDLHGKTAAAH